MENLKKQLSEEWNKPKEKNLSKKVNSYFYYETKSVLTRTNVDIRQPRDYEKIKQLHEQINNLKCEKQHI